MSEHSPETTPALETAMPHGEASQSEATEAPASAAPAPASVKSSVLPLVGAALGGAILSVVVSVALVTGGAVSVPQSPSVQKAVEGAQAQLSALSTKVEALATKPVAVPDITAQLLPLRDHLATLEKALGAEVALPKATPAQIGGLSARLDQAEMSASEIVVKLGRGSDQIAANTSALTALSTKVTGLESATQQTASQITTLTGQIAQAQALLKGAQIRLDQLEAAVNQLPDQRRLAVLGVASAALTRAAASGRGFAVELASVADLAPDLAALKDLSALAKDGAPLALDLAKVLPDKAILNSVAIAKDASLGDRVVASMKSWVNYRAKGDPASGVDTAVATMADALTKGDVPAALASWQALPDAAKAASEPWGSQLRARAAIDAAVAALNAQLSAQLNAK